MKILVALLFLVAAACAAPLLHSDSARAIPNRFLVVLHANLTKQHLHEHVLNLKDKIAATRIDAEITDTFTILDLIGFSCKLTKELLEAELAHEQVSYVEQDQVISLDYEQPEEDAPAATITQTGATWGIQRVSKRDLPLTGSYIYDSAAGSGVDSYIIDTGILTTHTQFGTRASAVFNAITGETNTDLNGHGTHVAGTVGGTTYGVAKLTWLYAVKVLSASGSGSTAGVISGVNYVTNSKSTARRSVANMSLGGGASPTLDTAVSNSIAAGTAYAIAAGNSNANACNSSPARVATAVTLGSSTNTDARSSFSNFGTCVTLFAPGSSITSAWIGGTSAINTISGTSMASPHACGALALRLSIDGTPSVAALKTWLINQATPNKITTPGAGSPNRLLFSPY